MIFFYISHVVVLVVLVGLLTNFYPMLCDADPTDGFTNIPLTESNFKLQKPYDISLEQRYSFQNGVHCLWVYADDKPPTQSRTEIRILGLDYSSGVWQFEGYAFVPNGTSGATIAQIHGVANDPKDTTILLRIFNGDMKYYSHDLVTTDLYDKWFRLNMTHNVDKGIVKVFINGSKKFGVKDRGPGDLFLKCGVYAAPTNVSYYMSQGGKTSKYSRSAIKSLI